MLLLVVQGSEGPCRGLVPLLVHLGSQVGDRPCYRTEEQPGPRFALADCEADHPDGAETLPPKIALLHLALP